MERAAIPATKSPTPQANADQVEEALLWQRLRESADTVARERLLALHMPYARVVAASYFAKRFHDEIEFEEYVQLASVGLLEAMDRYDPARGAQFRTFASRRMHGAILNGLEKLTEKQQQISARERIRSERLEAIKELAAESASSAGGRTTEQLFRYISEVGVGLALAWILEGTAMVEQAERCESLPFYRNVGLREFRDRLLRAVEALPSKERLVVRYHYLQEMPFEQVASTLNLTRGRISQIHKQALLRLRASVGSGGELDISF